MTKTNSFNIAIVTFLMFVGYVHSYGQASDSNTMVYQVNQEQIELYASAIDINESEWSTLDFEKYPEGMGTTSQYYYGRFELANHFYDGEKIEDWVLNFPLELTHIKLLKYEAAEQTQTMRTSGFFVPLNARSFSPIVKGNFFRIRQSAPSTTIYFEAKCARRGLIPTFEIQATETTQFYKQLGRQKQIQSFFIGFLFMMLVYNLFLYFYGNRDIAYIYYSVYLFGIVLYTTYNSGDLSDIVVPIFLEESPHLISYLKLVVYAVIFAYLVFLRRFLSLYTLLPRWDKILKWLSFLAVPFALLDCWLIFRSNINYDVADPVTLGFTGFFLSVVLIFTAVLYRTKDKNGLFIVIGTVAMVVGASITIYNRTLGADYSTVAFKIGAVLEVIAFSLGLAYRRRSLELGRQQAEFQLEKNEILRKQKQLESQQLKQLDELKTKLYTNITHEFRTPLTVIKGMAEELEGEDQKKELIVRNSNQLMRLVNQMLDLAKFESGEMKAKMNQGDIIAYLRYAFESFQYLARAKNINLTFYSEEAEIVMDFDDSKIEMIVYNLLSNAIKFTPENGQIVMHVQHVLSDSGNPLMMLKLKDTGSGINESDLPHIFDRFYQNADNSNDLGTGIGLSVVKQIVDLLEGEITVSSKIGEGSVFEVALPISNDAPLNNSAQEHPTTYAESTWPVETNKPVHDPTKKQLVLIEDNADVATYIKTILADIYNVTIYQNGEVGWSACLEKVPDIIISDIMMPGKNGIELTHLLKSDARTSHIPIILLTAKSGQQDRIDGLKAGADAYLTKPFDKEELFIRLDTLSALRLELMERYKSLPLIESLEKSHEPNLDEAFIIRITDYIHSNLENVDLTITDLSESMSLSHTQLYRKLKALTGKTPTLFVRSYRLAVAKKLLKEGQLNVSEVAYKVGFKDPNYFSRVFHKEFDVAPSDL